MVLIDLEIQQMSEKEAIHVVPPGELHRGFVSSIFLVPKKGDGQRPVVSLRPLNHGSNRFDDLLLKDFSSTFNNIQGVHFHKHDITSFPQSLLKSNSCKCT